MRFSHYPKDKRIVCEWKKDGIRHRTNSVEFGGIIPLHSHVGDHDASVKGNFDCIMKPPDGDEQYKKCKTGDKFTVPAFWKHTFIPTSIPSHLPQVWEVDCSWPEGRKL